MSIYVLFVDLSSLKVNQTAFIDRLHATTYAEKYRMLKNNFATFSDQIYFHAPTCLIQLWLCMVTHPSTKRCKQMRGRY